MSTLWHALVGYLVLTLTVRAFTRRPGAQMTLFEFVIVFLIGGVIILATVGHDRSMVNCMCAILVVASFHRFIFFLKERFPRFALFLDGSPLVLLRPNGDWQKEVMRGMHVAQEDILAAGRLRGVTSEDEIDYAILERNGGISIIPKEK